MYAVIRKVSAMRSVPEAARRAEIGIGQILKRSPGLLAMGLAGGLSMRRTTKFSLPQVPRKSRLL